MKMIAYQKMSKKQRRALDLRRRRSWGGISPVTRRAPDKKKYDRNRYRTARGLG